MENNFFSSFNSEESTGFNAALIQAMLNAVPVGVQFLRTIRDHHNNIIDFEYVPLKKDDGIADSRRTFLNSRPDNHHLFEKLKQLVETGVAFQTGYSPIKDGHHALLSFIKFADGVLISGNESDNKEKKKLITEGSDNNLPGMETNTVNESNELNKTLEEKNKELEATNAELKTINSVAAIEYKETIQKLYTNLEYIVSTNARVLNDASKANIRRAQSTIQRMKLLSDDIIHFLQLYDFGIHKTIIDPNPVIENVVSGMKGKLEQANARIESVRLPNLFADPLLLSILFARLIDNSIKFRKLVVSPLIKIKYSQADEMNAVAEARKNTAYAIISITDNGIGFEEEEAEKIFELFTQLNDKSKYKGSGIGLAICKKIMNMHGGFITAEGVPAGGATFNCYFLLENKLQTGEPI